jgi:hypothetical protein
MSENAIKKEECPRGEMYREALTNAVKISLILLKQNADGKMPEEVELLFKNVYFLLLEINGERFRQA